MSEPEPGSNPTESTATEVTRRLSRWGTYVAIGDSYTEGLWDHDGDPEHLRGWADRLAQAVSDRRHSIDAAPLRYANLAIRGRTLQRILDEQLEEALAMSPNLISIAGGGIDILRLAADPDTLAARLEAGIVRARSQGADVLMSTSMDTRRAGLLVSRTRERFAVYNAHIWSIAQRQGAHVLDQWGLRALADRRMWSPDRIHLSSEGHRRLSQGALTALGLPADDPHWRTSLPLLDVPRTLERVRDDAQWLRRDVAPWVARGLRRRSSGDGRDPKHARLHEVPPRFHR